MKNRMKVTASRSATLRMSLLVTAMMLVAGCEKKPEPTLQAAPSMAQAGPADGRLAETTSAPACEMVTAAEMSAIVGSEVTAKNNDRTGKTECIYTSTREAGPYVELSVAWGDGQAAMMGVGFLSSREPGIASPYDGLGDQAIAVGPALMIRTGEDLMQIVFSGVDDVPAAAKQIYTTAKGRM
jgi:hypothetical protein